MPLADHWIPAINAGMTSTPRLNPLGQPVGADLPGWTPRPLPPETPMTGRLCRIELLDADRHAADLHAAYSRDADSRHWTYLPYGPFDTLDAYMAFVRERTSIKDPLQHAVIDLATGKAVGVAAFMRIDPANGVIEVGNIRYSPLLQRTTAATEAMYLMMVRAFDELGYRRYEWKCDHLNAPSRRTAERLGFTFEGTFRQAVVVKGRTRDTDWLSIIDSEWPAIKAGMEAWLDPANFDNAGRQKTRLEDRIAEARRIHDRTG
jgi:RimJ/RimL family protein N-acetyltransferase